MPLRPVERECVACQAEKGAGGMPRGHVPRKDAESGETWAGSCKRAMSRPNPNGATRAGATRRTAGGMHRPSGGHRGN